MNGRSINLIASIGLALIAVGHAIWIMTFAGSGIDLTDDSYNLLMAMFPDYQLGALYWIGDLNSYLWKLSDNSIPTFRLWGMLVVFGSALILAFSAVFQQDAKIIYMLLPVGIWSAKISDIWNLCVLPGTNAEMIC